MTDQVKPTVFWCALMERSVPEHGAMALMRVAEWCGAQGYKQVQHPYQRTDTARNNLVALFLKEATHPHDVLVMLDCDHMHPTDLVTQLIRHDPDQFGVVGAQAHRRGEPFDLCAFIRIGDRLHTIAEWEDGALIECACVGTGAIAIRRWVFDRLAEAGCAFPYFRYAYQENVTQYPSEDMFFGLACEHAGIPHYVDTSVKTPHLISSSVDESTFKAWVADHQDQVVSLDEAQEKVRAVNEKRPIRELDVPAVKTRLEV